jgi:hypothetical protein
MKSEMRQAVSKINCLYEIATSDGPKVHRNDAFGSRFCNRMAQLTDREMSPLGLICTTGGSLIPALLRYECICASGGGIILRHFILGCVGILAACTPPPAPAPTPLPDLDKSALATCGAGFDQGTMLTLSGELQKQGALASAGFQQQARAAIFNSGKFTDPDKAYATFTSCIKDFQTSHK